MENNFLVIGAAGNVSLEIVKILANKNINVRVAARNPKKAEEMQLGNVDFMHFDYTNPETFKPVLTNIKSCLIVSPPAHYELHEYVRKVISHAIDIGVESIVNISYLGLHSHLNSFRIIEKYIEKSGIAYTIFRPNLYMQNFDTYFREDILETNSVSVPIGNSTTSYVDMRDVAEAVSNNLVGDLHDNKTYFLTGNTTLSGNDVARLFSEELNREINFIDEDEDNYAMILESKGWVNSSIRASISLCRDMTLGWTSLTTTDLRELLNRKPASMRNYIKDYIKVWQK